VEETEHCCTTPRRFRIRGHPGSATSAPGAPLWKVTDFAPGLSDAERAGLEAALEAAGILDAWVTPEGNLAAAMARRNVRIEEELTLDRLLTDLTG
jgi:hypothetical protein